MTPRGVVLGFLILAMGLNFLTGCGAQTANAKSKAPATTSQAGLFPEFTVKTLDNGKINLNSYRGKILILDLFATWCPPCKMEIPHFIALQNKYAGKLNVVGLSFDQGSVEDVKAFIKELKINYPVHWGNEEIAGYVGLRGIPHTLVIDPQGRVYHSYVGYRDAEVFEKDIQDLQDLAAAVGNKSVK